MYLRNPDRRVLFARLALPTEEPGFDVVRIVYTLTLRRLFSVIPAQAGAQSLPRSGSEFLFGGALI